MVCIIFLHTTTRPLCLTVGRRRSSNSTTNSLPRSQMMDSLVHTRQSDLFDSAASIDTANHLYDLPDELSFHPMRWGSTASETAVGRKSTCSPLSRGNEYQSSEKYMTMHPVGSLNSHTHHGTTQTLQTIHSEDLQSDEEEEVEGGCVQSVDTEQVGLYLLL